MRSKRPRGLTLVELLVVVAIVGLLAALTLPAVLSSRRAAERTQCASNLRQIGLALHQYHDVHRSLPPGWVALDPQSGQSLATGAPGWGWAAMLLPFIEQNPMCDRAVDFTKPANHLDHVRVRQTVLQLYRCPADVGQVPQGYQAALAMAGGATLPMALAQRWQREIALGWGSAQLACDSCGIPFPTLPDLPGFPPVAPPSGEPDPSPSPAALPTSLGLPAAANYVGVFGTAAVGPCAELGPGSTCLGDGVFFHNRPVRWSELTDGMSQTLLVGERSSLGTRPTWIGVLGGTDRDLSRVVGEVSAPLADTTERGFGSLHGGGAHFLAGDGSVHFLAETIALEVYRALATRGGAEPAAGF